MSEEQTVTYELEGEIALVGLNRPDKRNCFNPTVMRQLREAIDRAGEEAKCGIIFGHGDNFCAGLDLRWAAESWKTGRSERLPFPFNRNTFFEAMARGNIPFIAALHGATLGGGLETAAAAHIRVADETTFFALPGMRSLARGVYGWIARNRMRISCALRPHRSWSFVEIGNFDRIIWQADQGNSAHDYHPTDYDTERYGCWMSTCQRGDKRRYPDNEAADANTDPNDNLHFKSSSRMGQMNDAVRSLTVRSHRPCCRRSCDPNPPFCGI